MKITYKDDKQKPVADWTTKHTIFLCIFIVFVTFSLVMFFEYYKTGNIKYLGISITDMSIVGAWYLLLIY